MRISCLTLKGLGKGTNHLTGVRPVVAEVKGERLMNQSTSRVDLFCTMTSVKVSAFLFLSDLQNLSDIFSE